MADKQLFVEGSYSWSREEIATAGVWHYRAHNRWMGRWLSILLFAVAGLRLVLALLNHEPISVEIGFMIVILTIALISLLIPWIVRTMILASFARQADEGKVTHLKIDGKQIEIDAQGSTPIVIRWKELKKVVQTRDGILCYQSDILYHWLPFKAFDKTSLPALMEFAGQFPEKFKEIR